MLSLKRVKWIGAVLSIALLLSACSETNQGNSSNSSSAEDKPVTITVAMPNDQYQSLSELNERFQDQYPNIKIQFDAVPTDQYETLVNTKLASGDGPDLFNVNSGTKLDPLINSNNIMALNDESWVSRLSPSGLEAASRNGNVYALPGFQAIIGVVYNKQIFKELGLSIPQHWDEFLEVAQKIKDSGKIPLALGLRDAFVTQFIPYAMAPSAIYRDHANFDNEMYEGKQTFVGSPWEQMLADYLGLEEKGFFNDDVMGTGLDSMFQMMASGDAAMSVIVSPMIGAIRGMNPEIELGVFPLPYVKEGETIYVSTGTSNVFAVNANTKHPEAAKQYLDFLSQPDNMMVLIEGSLSAFVDVPSQADPAIMETEDAMKKGTYTMLDTIWPNTVQPTLFTAVQKVFTGQSIEAALKEMDDAFKRGIQ